MDGQEQPFASELNAITSALDEVSSRIKKLYVVHEDAIALARKDSVAKDGQLKELRVELRGEQTVTDALYELDSLGSSPKNRLIKHGEQAGRISFDETGQLIEHCADWPVCDTSNVDSLRAGCDSIVLVADNGQLTEVSADRPPCDTSNEDILRAASGTSGGQSEKAKRNIVFADECTSPTSPLSPAPAYLPHVPEPEDMPSALPMDLAVTDAKVLTLGTWGSGGRAASGVFGTGQSPEESPRSQKMTAATTICRLHGTLRQVWTQDVQPEAWNACRARLSIYVQAPCRSSGRNSSSNSVRSPGTVVLKRASSTREELCNLMMHPIGAPRLAWNAFSLALIAYDLFMIPMQAFDLGDGGLVSAMEWIATFFWSFDLILNFRTGHFVGSSTEMRPMPVAIQYAKTWLLLDIIIVAVEWASRALGFDGSASLLRSSRVLRVLRLMKLMRIAKLVEIWNVVGQQINSNLLQILATLAILTTILFIVIHMSSCLWYAIGEGSHDGWNSYDAYTGRKDTIFWYVASTRWVISQLNGRTDMDERRNLAERFFTCVMGVTLAVLGQALFISVITKSMLDLSELVSEKTRRRRLVNDYLEKHPVHKELTRSVKRYLNEYTDVGKEQENEEQVLLILPKHVQNEVLFEVRSPVLIAHPLFAELCDEFQSTMRYICRKVVKVVTAVKYEVVFDRGEACSRMLFLDKVTGKYGDPYGPGQGKMPWKEDEAQMGATATPSGVLSLDDASEAPKNRWFTKPTYAEFRHSKTGGSLARASMAMGRTPSQGMEDLEQGKKLKAGTRLSEPALWIEWISKGRLVASSHGHIFAVDATDLASALINHPDAFAVAVLYAREWLEGFNDIESPNDLSQTEAQFTEISGIRLTVTIESANGLHDADSGFSGKSDPYCVCKVQNWNKTRAKMSFVTQTINDSLNPQWNHSSSLSLCEGQSLLFEVWDSDFLTSDQHLGEVCLEHCDFLPNGFEGTLELQAGVGGTFSHNSSRLGGGRTGSIAVKVVVDDIGTPRLA